MNTKVYGAGPSFVLAIHGWGGDHREFAPIAAGVPATHRVVSVDLPGYGGTSKPSRWALAEIVRALGEQLDALPPPVTLAGYCSGAALAMMVARGREARVARLVLIDPLAFVPWYFRLFTWGEFGRRAYQTTFGRRMGRAATDRILQARQKTDASFTGAFADLDPEVTLAYLRMFRGAEDLAPYAGYRMPVDLCRGEHTFEAVDTSVRRLQALWPQARVHILRGTGHLPMVKGAAALRAILFGGA